MADEAKKDKDEQLDSEASKRAAFSPKMEKLKADLDLLYLKGNTGARHKFGNQYPEIAKYIFGEELINYDYEGCANIEEREHRRKLEEVALQRRFEILGIFEEIEDKSVKAGSLIAEYVSKVIDHFGVGVCRYIYTETIIERVRPGLLQIADDERERNKEKAENSGKRPAKVQEELNDDSILQSAEAEILASKQKDSAPPEPTMDDEDTDLRKPSLEDIADELDDIKPIDMQDGASQSIELGASPEKVPEVSAPESNPAPPVENSNPAPPLEAPLQQDVQQAPEIKKTELGPPLKSEEKKEAPSIFGKKPDFMNMKVSNEPEANEPEKKSYKELFNTLASKKAA